MYYIKFCWPVYTDSTYLEVVLGGIHDVTGAVHQQTLDGLLRVKGQIHVAYRLEFLTNVTLYHIKVRLGALLQDLQSISWGNRC